MSTDQRDGSKKRKRSNTASHKAATTSATGVTDQPGPSGLPQLQLKQQISDEIKELEESMNAKNQPSDEELDEAVKHGVRTIVLQARSSPSCLTFTPKQLVGSIKSAKARSLVLAYIQRKLLCVFGFELVNTHKVNPECSKCGQQVFLPRSALPLSLRAVVDAPQNNTRDAQRGLAFFLAHVVALQGHGNGIPESSMRECLKQHGARVDDSEHPTLGSVKDCVEQLFKARWLVRSATDTEEPFVHLGEGAIALVSSNDHAKSSHGIDAFKEHARNLVEQCTRATEPNGVYSDAARGTHQQQSEQQADDDDEVHVVE